MELKMSKERASTALLADLTNIDNIWRNADSSISILFDDSAMKSKICQNPLFDGLFESRHGFREYYGGTIIYIGILSLFEGEAHLYVPVIDVVNHD